MTSPTYLHNRGGLSYFILALVLAGAVAASWTLARRSAPALFRAPVTARGAVPPPHLEAVAPADATHTLRTGFVSKRMSIRTHAACLIELGGGKVRAFWYAGTDEGTQDVTIQTAVFDPRAGTWSEEKKVTDREATQRGLFRYVKKLGNPVVGRAADGSLVLYYVTVSVGGWSGGSLTTMTSRDDGETWSSPRRMITSPFFNLSTSVKSPPFAYADGAMGLPIHHEFLGKFAEILRFDGAAKIVDKVRLSSGRACLQPVILVEDANRALALMRYAGSTRPNRVMVTSTDRSGQAWTPVSRTTLANSNAALAGLVLPDGKLLVALNDAESLRNVLSLVVSSDGGVTWKTIYHIEDQSRVEGTALGDGPYSAKIAELARATDPSMGDARELVDSVKRLMISKHGYSFEFSYPSLLRTQGGDYHLVYTWNEALIKHVQFDQAWLDERMK